MDHVIVIVTPHYLLLGTGQPLMGSHTPCTMSKAHVINTLLYQGIMSVRRLTETE
jgi:hypothetical protein